MEDHDTSDDDVFVQQRFQRHVAHGMASYDTNEADALEQQQAQGQQWAEWQQQQQGWNQQGWDQQQGWGQQG